MIDKFPPHVADALEYYVYLLVDPRVPERKPFYVGKGKANRAFQHLRKEIRESTEPAPRYDVIDAIRAEGHEPGVVVAAHGLAEAEAFRLEAVLIPLLDLRELPNRVSGHQFDETMLDPDDLCLRYRAEKIADDTVTERVLYVSLNGGKIERPYPRIRNDFAELRRRTLGDWPISRNRAEKVDLAPQMPRRGRVSASLRSQSWGATAPARTRSGRGGSPSLPPGSASAP